MKTLKQILKQKPIYLNLFKDKVGLIGEFEHIPITSEEYYAKQSPYPNKESWEERKNKMSKALEKYENINILFAFYGIDDYCGEAFVLLEKNGGLFEVNASHCSCMGLEYQFDLEPTTLESLELRLTRGTFGASNCEDDNFATQLKEFLGITQKQL